MNTEDRYERHKTLEDFGPGSQERLKSRHVFVAGVGGLGGLVAAQLTATGVGTLTLCDPGLLELSNLNRQVFYSEADLDRPKVDLLADRLKNLSPETDIRTERAFIDASNAPDLIAGHDLVMDCLDNDLGRFALNAACVEADIPLVHGGIRGWSGEAALLIADGRPCFGCLRPEGNPKPQGPIPVISAAAGFIASLESHIALRHLLEAPDQTRSLHIWDGRHQTMLEAPLRRNPDCPVCGRS